MSRTPVVQVHRSQKWLAGCLLALLLLAPGAVHGTAVSAYALLRAGHASSAPAHLSAGAEVRSGPGKRYLLLAVTPGREEHALLGRSCDGLWLRIDFGGRPAWVAAAGVRAEAGNLPVVGVGGERL